MSSFAARRDTSPGVLSEGHGPPGAYPRAAQAAAGHRRARLADPGQHRAGGRDGRPERVFLQEELFGPAEYRQVVAYHYGMARHHLFKAQTYREHAKARFGLQLPLFDEEDGEV